MFESYDPLASRPPPSTAKERTMRSCRSSVATQAPVAKFLDVILYSREQIIKENAATGEVNDALAAAGEDALWGVISIKTQDVDHELPMQVRVSAPPPQRIPRLL